MRYRGGAAATLAVCVAIPLLIAGCSRPAPGPQANAGSYLSDWAEQDWQAMRQLADAPPADFVAVNTAAFKDLTVRQASFTAGALTTSGDTASEPVVARLQLAGLSTIGINTTLRLTQVQGKWLVNWTPETIDPELGPGDRMRLETIWPRRAPILAADGTPLATHGQTVIVGVEWERVKNAATVRSALVAAGATGSEATAALAAAKANPTFFEPVFDVTMARYQQLKPAIYPIPGTVFELSDQWQAITPGLASGLVGEMGPITAQQLKQLGAPYNAQNVVGQTGLEAADEQQLAGNPGADVTIVNKSGATVATVATLPIHPGSTVHTTISPAVQQAAEAALAGQTKTAALVAVNAKTGAILAADSVNAGYDAAVDGGFPPGSTFKILTSTALIEHGLSPSSAASCPATITEDGEVFHNAEGDSPVSTMLQAFTESCNTAFIGLASRDLTAQDFPATAARYDIGKTMHIGVDAYPGSVPRPADGADLAATSIGQGRVLVSPLDMAMVAAAVDTGTVREPSLVTGTGSTAAATTQLPGSVVSSLHTMMASVVASGTAAGQGLPAGTYAKTGTAEYGTASPLKLDAWLVGFNGKIAFAALVVNSPGDGGPTCGPLVAKFLAALGY